MAQVPPRLTGGRRRRKRPTATTLGGIDPEVQHIKDEPHTLAKSRELILMTSR